MALRKSRVLLVLVLVSVVVVAVLLAVFLPQYLERRRYASGLDGCATVPMAPEVTPETHSTAFRWPYGAVHDCRVLGGGVQPFGEAEVSYTLVLETDAGPVLVRLDYYNLGAGRQFVAQAVELGPGRGELPAGEVTRIRAAIQARGGLESTPWIVHYGDG